MKTAKRFGGAVHESVEIRDSDGELTRGDITVIGPSDRADTVSVAVHYYGLSASLLLRREEARRFGELLLQAAADNDKEAA